MCRSHIIFFSIMDKFDRFGGEMPDRRLTAPSDDKVYGLREAVLVSIHFGKPLTQEEMKEFEV